MTTTTKITGKSFRLLDFTAQDEKYLFNNDETEEDTSDEDEQTPQTYVPPVFIIQMFGINELGETCCIFIKNYKPFFYVKVAQHWTQENINILFDELKRKLEPYNKKYLLSAELVKFNKLYGFSGGKKTKFAKLTFENISIFNRIKNLWYHYSKGSNERKLKPFISQNVLLELYESKIPPILRYFHIHNISPSGWVFIPTTKMNNPAIQTTTCKYEYICDCEDLIPQPKKETRTPYKICSFDIEASSSHGDFPVPVKSYKRLASHLMDSYSKHNSISPMNAEQLSAFIKSRILAGYGFVKYSNIDLVYPKTSPTKTELIGLIDNMLSFPIHQINNEMVNVRKHNVLTIESIFDKIRSSVETAEGGYTNIDADADADDEQEEETMTTPSPVRVPIPPHSSTTKDKKIQDIFTDTNFTRDEKINHINEIFVHCLPELEGDKVTFIGSTFLHYGENEPYMNHCIVLNTCDTLPNTVIETVPTERELLIKWTELIQRENPDIIIGYNIFGFDYEFMFRRSQENNCEREFLSLSRKNGELSANYNRQTHEITLDNTKIVLATGEYDLKYPKMSGRIQIDLYAYFRRDFNLSSYKLDDVAGEFIGDSITLVNFDEEKQQTHLHTNNIVGLHVGDFIHIELSLFTTDYYKDCKFPVLNIINNVKNDETPHAYTIVIDGLEYELIQSSSSYHTSAKKTSIKWCMAKDDITPKDIFRLTNGDSADRAKVAKYCIQDCNLVHHLFHKLDIMTGYIEMSRICSVPISYLVLRGQGIKLTSFVAKKCREKNTLMPDIEKKGTHDGYEGAIVLPPKCAMYMDNPVACVDYSSLYPSSMISQNYSHDSKVWTKEYNLEGVLIRETGERDAIGKYIYDGLEGYEYIDIDFDTFEWRKKPTSKAVAKVKVGHKICRWAQLPNGQKSIMPSILEELLKARKETRDLIKTEKDVFMQNILDKRQVGYKVTANSLYGQCGSKTSTFYEQDVAASTTATGRMMIIYAKRIIEEVYGDMHYMTKNHGEVICNAEYVYGDTDSVFFTFNLKDPSTANNEPIRGKKALEITIEIAQDVAKLCTQFLKPPMELSYEKTLYPFCLLSKKRYFGKLFEENPDKGKLKFMGLSLKRRDNCDLLKDVYGHMLNTLLLDDEQLTFCNKMEMCIEHLNHVLEQLIQGLVSMDKLAITKSLSGYYKNPEQIAHAVLAERIGNREAGNKPKPGDRIKFVHIVSANNHALQGEKIETPEFITHSGVKIDYIFYITNQLMKPLQQLFGLALSEILTLKGDRYGLKTYKKDIQILIEKYGNNLEEYAKKKEKYCSDRIKSLIFEKYLVKIKNQINGYQPIERFFTKK
jgi:DNA polymerase elongation subunit (family B)